MHQHTIKMSSVSIRVKDFADGFEDVLSRYREIVPHLRLAGPTSFAPIIEMAMSIVEQSGGQYHVLVIIADGQVTKNVDTKHGRLSPQEQKTVDTIVAVSKFPLSIILVGVGDGLWDMMKEFDDNIPARAFDNFQFVNFTEIMSKSIPPSRKEAAFALAALMEIPSQYMAAIELNLLGSRQANAPQRHALPPPTYSSRAARFEPSIPPQHGNSHPFATAPSAPSSTYDNQLCPICLSNAKDMAFGCGHQTCCECGQDLQSCPMYRSPINTRIKLYNRMWLGNWYFFSYFCVVPVTILWFFLDSLNSSKVRSRCGWVQHLIRCMFPDMKRGILHQLFYIYSFDELYFDAVPLEQKPVKEMQIGQ
ncbi:hypothetical protein GYH30_052853 [Glycine max]|nr:hypothetical protein GYH30_052853 [Glycine max]KAH1077519.1 hypothetical protein GYH30_052853 [Glycine max]